MGKTEKSAIIIIIALGAALRIWGINFGLPFQFHQDEPIIVNHAMAYGTGDLNPHFFIIPPLTSYVLFIFYAAYYFLLHMMGVVNGREEFVINFIKDPSSFYLIGRVFAGLLPSAANIYIVYRLTAEFFSKKAALYSALVMALVFLNVINGHFIYTDNLLVMFSLISYMAMSALMKQRNMKSYIICGIFIGIASAVKYNAILLVFPFIIAHLFSANGKPISTKILTGAMVVVLSFIVFNPFAILDWRFFLLSITGRIRQGYMGWTHHIFYSLFEGVGGLVTMLGFTGLVAMVKRSFKPAVLFLSFPMVFYIHLVFKSQPFSRYVLPLIPFLSIGLGFLFYDYIYPKLKSRPGRFIIIALSIITLVPTSVKSLKADILFTEKDTRIKAAEWIKDNLPARTKIALDHTFFTPPLKQTIEQLKEKECILEKQPELKELKSRKLDLQIRSMGNDKGYEIYYLVEGRENMGQFLKFWPVIKIDTEILKKCAIQYVVINNMTLSEEMRGFQNKIAKMYESIAQFSPYQEEVFRRSYDEVETTCIPIGSKEIFSRKCTGPYIIIYKTR